MGAGAGGSVARVNWWRVIGGWLGRLFGGAGAPPAGPVPGEIWWARVPFEDGPGAKDRPCLVLRVTRRGATVVKITSKQHERPGVLPLPRGLVGDRQERASWLETDELREVRLGDFRRRVGPVDERTWSLVRRAAG